MLVDLKYVSFCFPHWIAIVELKKCLFYVLIYVIFHFLRIHSYLYLTFEKVL